MDIKEKCRYCGKGGKLKHYIIGDDMEHPKPYHKKCMEKLKLEMMIKIYEEEQIPKLNEEEHKLDNK